MIKLALVGKSIGHSQSQSVYEGLLKEKVDYHLLDYPNEKEIPSLSNIFRSDLAGLSITAPYKRFFLNDVSMTSEIKRLEAINCIRKTEDSFAGTNTDYLACIDIFNDLLKISDQVIILGDGAMSKLCQIILEDMKKEVRVFSRKKDGDIEKLNLEDYGQILLVNTCAREFVFRGEISAKSVFWDLNYLHVEHERLWEARCHYVDGMELLRLQAQYALDFWGMTR